jgi:hypothetical protein
MLPQTRYIDAGPGLPQASASAAMAQGQALAQMGQTISQIGEAGLQIAGQVRKAKEAGAMSSFFAQIDQEASEFSNSLMTRNDPDAWPADWKAFNETVKERARELGLSPVARQKLDLEIQDWSTQRTIRFETLAAQRSVTEAKARVANNVQYYMDRKQFPEARRESARMPDLGFMPSEIEQVERNLDRIEQRTTLEDEIDADPAGMRPIIFSDSLLETMSGLTDQDREALKKRVDAKSEELCGDEIEILETALAQGKLTPNAIDSAKYLNKKDRVNFNQAIGNDAPSNLDHAAAWEILGALREARNDPAVTNGMYQTLYNMSRGSLLARIPPQWQGDLKQELSYLSPAARAPGGGGKPGTDDVMLDLLAAGRRVLARAYKYARFGPVGESATYQQQEESARKYELANIELKRWIRSLPVPPKDDEVFKYAYSLVAPQASAQGAENINLPGARRVTPRRDVPTPRTVAPSGSSSSVLPKKGDIRSSALDDFLSE